MMHGRAKEVSESYKGSEISFDKTTAASIAKGFVSTNIQDAIVEAKAVNATTAIRGLARAATDAEAANGTNVDAYTKPKQVNDRIIAYANQQIFPRIPTVPAIPTAIYGGAGWTNTMIATYSWVPVGTMVVYEEAFNEEYGYGNGTAWRVAYRRSSIIRTNAGWMHVWRG